MTLSAASGDSDSLGDMEKTWQAYCFPVYCYSAGQFHR